MTVMIINGNCLTELAKLPADSVHCAVSSPPYYGLRDYGLEPTWWGGDFECDHVAGDELKSEGRLRRGAGLAKLSEQHRGGGKKASEVLVMQGSSSFCVHCGAWRGALGLEPTPELFVEHLVAVCEQVRRVLRPDGTLWLNLGDSYYSPRYPGGVGENSTINGQETQEELRKAKLAKRKLQRGGFSGNKGYVQGNAAEPHRSSALVGLKPKDLIGTPWLVAFALRRAGWYLRQDIVWHKPNPMPESTEDRCTKAHEYLFLLAKSEHYYYDAEAIKEPSSGLTNPRGSKLVTPKSAPTGSGVRANESWHASTGDLVDKRNKRSVWSIDESADMLGHVPEGKPEKSGPWPNHDSRPKGSFDGQRALDPSVPQSFRAIVEERNRRSVWTIATRPFAEAHFATFPPELVEPCVMAGTSERGCCPACRSPWRRVTAPSERYLRFLGRSYHDHEDDEGKGQMQQRGENRQNLLKNEGGMTTKEVETVGWWPTCACDGLGRLPDLPRPPRLSDLEGYPEDDEDLGPEERKRFDLMLEAARKGWRAACAPVYAEWRERCAKVRGVKTVPAVVMDFFGGAGTVGMVADRLQRDAILIEAKPDYVKMIERRIGADELPLFPALAAAE